MTETTRAEPPVYRRSPRALGALLLSLLLAAVTLAFIHLLDRTDKGLRHDAFDAIDRFPESTGFLLDSLGLTVVAGLVVSFGYDQISRGRYRTVAIPLVSASVAAGTAAVLAGMVSERWFGSPGWDLTMGMAAAASGAAGAACVICSRSSAVATANWVMALLLVVGGASASESLVGRVLLLCLGAMVASVVALIVGTPSSRPTVDEVREGLHSLGMRVATLEPHGGDARGSTPWIAELESGTRVFAKTTTTDERLADLIFRLWRRVYLRDPGDRRPSASLQQAAEHEAFAATRAIAVGVRVPRVLGIGRLPKGGVVTVHESVAGTDLQAMVDEHGNDAIHETQLREMWSVVGTLHRAGIAHRDLRAANVLVDDDGAIWLVDFAVADVVSDERARHGDLVELLGSTAALVGVEAAVDAAVTTLGEATWIEALPMVQPLAVSVATRHALGKSGFADVRSVLADRIQAPEPDLPRLGRLDRKMALTLIALGVATWTLLPQLADSGEVWKQIPQADTTRLALAALASVVTYIGATIGLRASVPNALPWFRTLLSQVASSFANRVTPAKVGGVALNVRWMTNEGVAPATAAGGVSLNALTGGVVHFCMTVSVVLWAGRTGLGDLETPPARTIGLGLALVAALVAIGYLIPPLRHTIRYRVMPRTKESWREMRSVVQNRSRLIGLFVGSALVTISYIAALSLSAAAVDADLAVSTAALVYLAGSAIASAAPTPGGLGATEATFAAAMTAVGVGQSSAVAAVLLYRLVTYWLPIIPGALAYSYLRRRGSI